MDEISREDWMEQLKSLHITRVDMNKLIMNYLVTGRCCHVSKKADIRQHL